MTSRIPLSRAAAVGAALAFALAFGPASGCRKEQKPSAEGGEASPRDR